MVKKSRNKMTLVLIATIQMSVVKATVSNEKKKSEISFTGSAWTP